MWGWGEVQLVDRRGCGPAGGQWDNQDGKVAAGSVKDCGVGQGCTLPGWGYEVLFFQAAASTCSPLPGPDVQDAWPPVEYYQDNPYRCPISSY